MNRPDLTRVVQANSQGLYAFPSLVPGSYTVKVTAKSFHGKELTGIVLHAGDSLAVPAITLAVGAADASVTVEAAGQLITIENGQRTNVLDSKQIENLALPGRDTTELLKVLPGATTVSTGLTNNSPAVQQSQHGCAAERRRLGY